jgi:large subunit ribosomal protein L2
MSIKKYKPVTPSLRNMIKISKPKSLSKESIRELKKLGLLKHRVLKHSGRNHSGKITVRHKGGGHKRLHREIDSKRIYGNYSYNIVERIDYDPSKSGFLALIRPYTSTDTSTDTLYNSIENKKWYILAPEGLKKGDIIKGHKVDSLPVGAQPSFDRDQASYKDLASSREHASLYAINIKEFEKPQDSAVTNLGESKPIKDMILGTNFYNLDGKFIRSAGTSGIVLKHNEELGLSTIKLPSGKITSIDSSLTASVGVVSNVDNYKQKKGKAGVNRWLGIRPTVRGEAMNPVDHPHGGKSHGSGGLGNPAKNKWGKLAKWVKTVKTNSKN